MARETQGSPANEKRLEQYGVWVKVKPRDVTTAPVLEESFELSDLETPKLASSTLSIADESGLTAEEEKLLDELETELEPGAESAFADEAPAISVPEEEPLLADAELPDIETATGREGSSDLEFRDISDEELPELEEDLEPAPRGRSRASAGAFAEPAEVEVTLSERVGEENHFDDLAALESELASVTTKTRDASSSSAEILARIEDELKSIRTDLNQLRHDLSGLRKTAAESAAEGPSSASGGQGGFFDEDDETIALTGDELDNILNTAEITEESAEAPGAAADMDLMVAEGGGGSGDILGYETPAPEPVEAPVLERDLEIPEDPLADDTLVLSDDDLLQTDGSHQGSGASAGDDLPADLVLEELPESDSETLSDALGSADLPEIDLEGIPEMESEPTVAPAPSLDSAMDDMGSETIDLETLDLGEEPKVIDAVPEQVEEIEELQEADDLMGDGTSGLMKGLPAAESATEDEVDLEALAAEAEDLEDNVPLSPVVEDLEIGELETLSDEAGTAASPQKEIEINFEGDLADDVEALQVAVGPGTPSDEIPEAEEVSEAAPAGIPDNLKDEIRTVLKYMDHLLEALPDEKIQEFASSDYFVMYKKLFEDLGLGE